MDRYERLESLGSGGQGKIVKVRQKKTGKLYACKIIRGRSNYDMNLALNETKVLRDLNHRHIIRYKDFFMHKDRDDQWHVCLVMEFCEFGDLSIKVQEIKAKRQKFDERTIIQWMLQLCSALQYLHGNNMIHRDVKSTNVFFSKADAIKLGDFGVTTQISSHGKRSIAGSPFYFAPELVLQQKYDCKADMWGLGTILLELVTLRERKINDKVIDNPQILDEIHSEVLTNGYSTVLADLCRDLHSPNPSQRPSATEVLQRLAACDARAADGDPKRTVRVTAGMSLREALGHCGDGDVILVGPGYYKEAETLDITRNISILGEGATREDVVIEVMGQTAVSISSQSGRLANLTVKQSRRLEGDGDKKRCFGGVDIRSGVFKVQNCDVSSECGSCIVISKGADPTIEDCKIHDGKQAGLYVFDQGKGIIRNNLIVNNEYANVLLKRGANPVITRNKIKQGKETGVFICRDSWGSLTENEVAHNAGSGIVIKGGACPTIRKNDIHHNQQTGVFLCEKGRGIISENSIHNNARGGVAIKTNANPSVVKNRIYQGNDTGVFIFEHGEGTVEDNDIYENTNAGVLVTTGGNPKLIGNRIHRNEFEGIWVCNNGMAYVENNDLRFNKGPYDIADTCKENVQLHNNRTA